MTVALVEYELVGSDGAALPALDADYYYVATAMTGGSDQDITGSLAATQATYGRSVTASLVDADASVTQLKVYLSGLDTFGRAITETLSFTGSPGTSTQESNYAFRELTSVIYHADGTVGGTDTLALGFKDKLGLPREITSVSDILKARVDSTAYENPASGAGTFNATYGTWEPLGGVIPNASRRYYIQVKETI